MAAPTKEQIVEKLTPLVTRYRERCLWFLRQEFIPSSSDQAIRVLDCIEKHGDRQGFIEARRLKSWLLQTSSPKSSG